MVYTDSDQNYPSVSQHSRNTYQGLAFRSQTQSSQQTQQRYLMKMHGKDYESFDRSTPLEPLQQSVSSHETQSVE